MILQTLATRLASFRALATATGCLLWIALPGLNRESAGQLTAVSRSEVSGTVTAIAPGEISIRPPVGAVLDCKLQGPDQRAISLGGVPQSFPADIEVTGALPVDLVQRGMLVTFDARCNVYGQDDGEVHEVRMVAEESLEPVVDFQERPEEIRDFVPVKVVGHVINFKGQKLQLRVPKAKWAKRETIFFKMAEDARLLVRDDQLSRVQPGDRVRSAEIWKLSSGESVIRSIQLELTAEREQLNKTIDDQLNAEFRHLSDEPGQPRELRSAHFILMTDLSDRSAQILLAKLERMHDRVSHYFRAKPRLPISCYVVSNLSLWNGTSLDPVGVNKIQQGAGVTVSRSLGRAGTRSVVYSCGRHDVVQHEAVHAFCAQTFGSTGPTWYSEGMAEMGNYWRPENLEIEIDPVVIEYLTHAEPKKMADIVAAGQITGDSWQAYAWRWALCHLLASNPNYARRFKTLGVKMMSGQADSFENAFGDVADQISFEYDQFVANMGNGYRVDLCVWDWQTRYRPLSRSRRINVSIDAQAGWQATGVEVKAGESYDFVAIGQWKTGPADAVDADGDDTGTGRLEGVVLHDFTLSDPFPLGARGSVEAPVDGQLYVRCRDAWTQLSDNEGQLELHLRITPRDSDQ